MNKQIEKIVHRNQEFWREVKSTNHTREVVMCLYPGEKFSERTRVGIDQVIHLVKGRAKITVNGMTVPISDKDVVYIPSATDHKIENIGPGQLKLYITYRMQSVYSPRHDVMPKYETVNSHKEVLKAM